MLSPQLIAIRQSRETGSFWQTLPLKAALKALEGAGYYQPDSARQMLLDGQPVWNPFYTYRLINLEHFPALTRFLQRNCLPERVIQHENGACLSGAQAVERGLPWEIVFIRDDGWSLGAPAQLQNPAEEMWQNQWIAVYYPASARLESYAAYLNGGGER